MDLSIIVPVYNVEKYVKPCIESIFKQGLDESRFEVIIVNDGSTDKSMDTISDIIQAHDNITVIHQKNLSLSVARNNGLAQARGEYIFMPDSDDLLIENSLKPLLEKALETRADFVAADFLAMTTEEIDSFQGVKQDHPVFEMKSGEDYFIQNLNPYNCYVWRSLYRRQFLEQNHITFVPKIFYQDIPFTHECCLKAERCVKATWVLNIYRKIRKGSNTTHVTQRNLKSLSIAIATTWRLRTIEGLSSRQLRKLEDDVYKSFSLLIYRTIFIIHQRAERNEVMDYLKELAPDLNFTHGIRQCATTFMFRHMPHLFINAYYYYAKYAYKHGKD